APPCRRDTGKAMARSDRIAAYRANAGSQEAVWPLTNAGDSSGATYSIARQARGVKGKYRLRVKLDRAAVCQPSAAARWATAVTEGVLTCQTHPIRSSARINQNPGSNSCRCRPKAADQGKAW